MKKRYWLIGGIAVVLITTLLSGNPSPSSLCSGPKTKSELDRVFTSKLSRFSATLMDDYSVHGQRGNDVVCSVSFRLNPAKGNPEETIGSAPTTAAEMETYQWAMAMLPNLMVTAATNPGQALVQRVTYQVAKTANDGRMVTLVDFPGMRNLTR